MIISLLQFEYSWKVNAYLRFCGIEYEEDNASYPSVDSTVEGILPQLRYNGRLIGKNSILDYLKNNIKNIDDSFSESIQCEISLLTDMIENVCDVFYQNQKWSSVGKNKSYLYTVYSSVLSSPYTEIYFKKMQNQYKKLVKELNKESLQEQLSLVEDVYRILNEKLHEVASQMNDDMVFLYGNKPSSLDVAFFHHIAMVYEYSAGFMESIRKYPTIVSYYERIMKSFFSPAWGEKTTDNRLLKAYGFHISCQPSKNPANVLPYLTKRDFEYETAEREEKLEYKMIDPDQAMENRKRVLTLAMVGFMVLGGLLSFMWCICWKEKKCGL